MPSVGSANIWVKSKLTVLARGLEAITWLNEYVTKLELHIAHFFTVGITSKLEQLIIHIITVSSLVTSLPLYSNIPLLSQNRGPKKRDIHTDRDRYPTTYGTGCAYMHINTHTQRHRPLDTLWHYSSTCHSDIHRIRRTNL